MMIAGGRAHDVYDVLRAKPREIIRANDGVAIAWQDLVQPGFVFQKVIGALPVFRRPLRVSGNTRERKSLLPSLIEHLLNKGEHFFLIEAALAQIRFVPVAQFQLAALLRGHCVDARAPQPPQMFLSQSWVNHMEGWPKFAKPQI